nr:uncharacterized protein LOC116434077 [Nomia melanderi]
MLSPSTFKMKEIRIATKVALQKYFDPNRDKLRVKAIRHINKGGILVEMATKDDLQKLIKSGKANEKGLKVTVPTKKKPNFKSQNEDLATDEIKPLFKTAKGKNWVVETSPKTREAILSRGRLFLGWHACRVRDYVVAGRCFRCQAFGHIAKHCWATVDTCGHCAKEGHCYKDCPNKEENPSCINCKRAKRPHNHPSRKDECPPYKKALETLVSKTDYGD